MTVRLATVGLVLLMGVPGGGEASRGGTSHYVSPSGSSAGDGTLARPWDLATAWGGGCAGGRIAPGYTIWLCGGTYRGVMMNSFIGPSLASVGVRHFRREWTALDA